MANRNQNKRNAKDKPPVDSSNNDQIEDSQFATSHESVRGPARYMQMAMSNNSSWRDDVVNLVKVSSPTVAEIMANDRDLDPAKFGFPHPGNRSKKTRNEGPSLLADITQQTDSQKNLTPGSKSPVSRPKAARRGKENSTKTKRKNVRQAPPGGSADVDRSSSEESTPAFRPTPARFQVVPPVEEIVQDDYHQEVNDISLPSIDDAALSPSRQSDLGYGVPPPKPRPPPLADDNLPPADISAAHETGAKVTLTNKRTDSTVKSTLDGPVATQEAGSPTFKRPMLPVKKRGRKPKIPVLAAESTDGSEASRICPGRNTSGRGTKRKQAVDNAAQEASLQEAHNDTSQVVVNPSETLYLVNWIPRLRSKRLYVEGQLLDFSKPVPTKIEERWTTSKIVRRVNQHTVATSSREYCLEGNLLPTASDNPKDAPLPHYIMHKFRVGFPDNWQELVDFWIKFEIERKEVEKSSSSLWETTQTTNTMHPPDLRSWNISNITVLSGPSRPAAGLETTVASTSGILSGHHKFLQRELDHSRLLPLPHAAAAAANSSMVIGGGVKTSSPLHRSKIVMATDADELDNPRGSSAKEQGQTARASTSRQAKSTKTSTKRHQPQDQDLDAPQPTSELNGTGNGAQRRGKHAHAGDDTQKPVRGRSRKAKDQETLVETTIKEETSRPRGRPRKQDKERAEEVTLETSKLRPRRNVNSTFITTAVTFSAAEASIKKPTSRSRGRSAQQNKAASSSRSQCTAEDTERVAGQAARPSGAASKSPVVRGRGKQQNKRAKSSGDDRSASAANNSKGDAQTETLPPAKKPRQTSSSRPRKTNSRTVLDDENLIQEPPLEAKSGNKGRSASAPKNSKGDAQTETLSTAKKPGQKSSSRPRKTNSRAVLDDEPLIQEPPREAKTGNKDRSASAGKNSKGGPQTETLPTAKKPGQKSSSRPRRTNSRALLEDEALIQEPPREDDGHQNAPKSKNAPKRGRRPAKAQKVDAVQPADQETSGTKCGRKPSGKSRSGKKAAVGGSGDAHGLNQKTAAQLKVDRDGVSKEAAQDAQEASEFDILKDFVENPKTMKARKKNEEIIRQWNTNHQDNLFQGKETMNLVNLGSDSSDSDQDISLHSVRTPVDKYVLKRSVNDNDTPDRFRFIVSPAKSPSKQLELDSYVHKRLADNRRADFKKLRLTSLMKGQQPLTNTGQRKVIDESCRAINDYHLSQERDSSDNDSWMSDDSADNLQLSENAGVLSAIMELSNQKM